MFTLNRFANNAKEAAELIKFEPFHVNFVQGRVNYPPGMLNAKNVTVVVRSPRYVTNVKELEIFRFDAKNVVDQESINIKVDKLSHLLR